MNLGLRERRALVLGSSSGIGSAIAESLAVEGARVAVHGRDAERADAVARNLPDAVVIKGDLAEPGEAARVVDEAAAALGGLDVVVVNTGGGAAGGVLDADDETDAAAYASMLRPALGAARAAVPHLRASDQARMVFLTARSIQDASTTLALSGIFRSGVAAAAGSLAKELASAGVLVNVIVTGQFETPALQRYEAWLAEAEGVGADQIRARHRAAIPLGRIGDPGEIADVVTFLCSARASYVTGVALRVDGGAGA